MNNTVSSRQKMQLLCFEAVFKLKLDSFMTIRLSHTNAFRINQFYLSKDQSMKYSQKILRINNFESAILDFFSKKIKRA